MANVVVSDPGLSEALASKRTLFNTGTLKLFKNDLNPTPATALGAFVEADYAGYVAQVTTDWGPPIQLAEGSWYIDLPTKFFPAATSGAQIVFGVFFEAPSGALEFSCRFDAPITVDTTTGVDVDVRYTAKDESVP